MLDVGCNRRELRQDKYYLGERRERLEGGEYHAVVEEFCGAVKKLWPHALLQVGMWGCDSRFGPGVAGSCMPACMPRTGRHCCCTGRQHSPAAPDSRRLAWLSLPLSCCPSCLQFEDFSTDKAFEILHRQRDRLLCCERSLPARRSLLGRGLP